MDSMMLIVSIAAIVALAVVFTRVLTLVFKVLILGAIVYFVATQVDFKKIKYQLEHWNSPTFNKLKSSR